MSALLLLRARVAVWRRVAGPADRRRFATSTPREALPPAVALLWRPAAKVVAFLAGRVFRKWWRRLPQEQRDQHRRRVSDKKSYIVGGGALTLGLGLWYYGAHLEETPITGRRRFVAVSDRQMAALARTEFRAVCSENASRIVDVDHPVYAAVDRVVNRLLRANRTLPEIYTKNWTITVIDDRDQRNAFVLPTGNIFVFTGMLATCNSEDELGVILGHEMAHALLGHAYESVSRRDVLDLLKATLLGVLTAVLPSDLSSLLTFGAGEAVADVVLQYPNDRMMEDEADLVGLFLAAQACYDVRSASAFWSKMEALAEVEETAGVEWLSTHPSHGQRQRRMEQLLPLALEHRVQCRCPDLDPSDPRHEVEAFKKALLESGTAPLYVARVVPLPDLSQVLAELKAGERNNDGDVEAAKS